jgi:uridine kinase
MQTETPMTIGLQGDWGSGKTSLMNLISARLKDRYPVL